jgi:hypothetical protein
MATPVILTKDFGDYAFLYQHCFHDDPHRGLTHDYVNNLQGTDIHDIWHYKNFRDYGMKDAMKVINRLTSDIDQPGHDFPLHVYARMRPAFRLATRLLDRARYSLMRIAYAPISRDGSHFTDNYRVDKFMEDDFDRLLDDISNSIRFFHFAHNEAPVYACTALNPGDHLERAPYISAIAQDYLLAFADAEWDNLPMYHKDSIYVSLGVILVHELAHAIFKHQYRDSILEHKRIYGFETPEPALWEGDHQNELGEAVERYLFGGRIQLPTAQVANYDPNNTPSPQYDGSLGLAIILHHPYAGCTPEELPNYNSQVWFIQPLTLLLLQHTTEWENVHSTRQDSRGRFKKVPFRLGLQRNPILVARQSGIEQHVGAMLRLRKLQRDEAESQDGVREEGFDVSQASWWRRRQELEELRVQVANARRRYF